MTESEVPARTLSQNEGIIERGLSTFVEVGNALREVRDARQYVDAGYDTFESYLDQRWRMSRPYAYQLIDAASVSAIADITNEGQARALTPVLKAKGEHAVRQVWAKAEKRAAANGGHVTAKVIREVLPKRQPRQRTTVDGLDVASRVLMAVGREVESLTPEVVRAVKSADPDDPLVHGIRMGARNLARLFGRIAEGG